MNYNTIILSGLPGSGKTSLAELLSTHYSWPVHSIGQLFREEWKRRHPHGDVSFEAYWRDVSFDTQRDMNIQARSRAIQGNVILDTRYAICYSDLPALRVFITADIDTRTLRALNSEKYEGDLFQHVRTILIEQEQDEVKIGRVLFGIEYDYRNPRHYHLVLDSGTMPLDEEVARIHHMMTQSETQPSLNL